MQLSSLSRLAHSWPLTPGFLRQTFVTSMPPMLWAAFSMRHSPAAKTSAPCSRASSGLSLLCAPACHVRLGDRRCEGSLSTGMA